ncbi:putative transcriptional regulator [Rhodococcus sp. MTM3W5.2]|nr:putative transcriptional regulator [Rhodococcus sp. MTM3W5.2]
MTVDALLIAGERMFADRGADVPLREIAIAAGQRNNSAVQYHFGDRQGLIAAIVRRRLQSVEASGARLLVGVDRGDTHALVEVLVASLVDTSVEQGSTHYFRFLEVMRTQVKGWPAGDDTTWSMITNTLAELLPRARGGSGSVASHRWRPRCSRSWPTSSVHRRATTDSGLRSRRSWRCSSGSYAHQCTHDD